MAKTGLKHFVYGKPNADYSKYTGGRVLGAIQCNVSITNNDTKLYVDDVVKETDKSFASGTIDIITDDLLDEDKAEMLGHEIDEESGEIIYNSSDVTPELGYGFYGQVSRNNKKMYRAVFLLRVQFAEPSDENDTKGESTEFKTQAMSGSVLTLPDGRYKTEKTFATEQEAITWLDEKVGYGQLGTLTVNSAEGTAAGKTKITVTPSKGDGNSYKYKTDTEVTAPKFGEVCDSGYTDWDGTAEITATTGNKILVVEVDAEKKANVCRLGKGRRQYRDRIQRYAQGYLQLVFCRKGCKG